MSDRRAPYLDPLPSPATMEAMRARPSVDLLARAERIRDQALKCSFCGKTAREVETLVEAATGARICNECVSLCIPLMGPCCMPR